MMMQNSSKELFISKFQASGADEFYLFLLRYAQTRISESSLTKGTSPEIELLNYSDQFLQIYRRENKEIYKLISYSFKRAAHKAYRSMLKKNLIKRNKRFLNLVE